MSYFKTPLRYPGGKSKAIKRLETFFPYLGNYTHYREPFLGGGSVALYIAQKYPHLKIHVNDKYSALHNFWYYLQNEGTFLTSVIQRCIRETKDKKKLFLESKERVNNEEPTSFLHAVAFYICNRCSFSGLTASGGFSKIASEERFTENIAQDLIDYSFLIKNWTITNWDYSRMMEETDEKTFVYLDPPYDIKDSLYGNKGGMHKGFDHDRFARVCRESKLDQLISYNADEKVRERFDGWNMNAFSHTYSMQSVGDYAKEQKKRKELVMWNYGITNYF